MPASERGRWLAQFARLYRDLVAATRSKDGSPKRPRFHLLPTAWLVKLAMIRHVLIVHRFKERDEPLLTLGLEGGRLLGRAANEGGFLGPANRPAEPEADADATDVALPAWMIDDFEAFAANEPALWPDRDFLSRFVWYKPSLNRAPGWLYFELHSSLSSARVEAVVICPWLIRGGADKGVLQFVEYYASRGGVALVTTLAADSPWLAQAPKGVRTVEFGKLARDLSEDDKITVLARLLLELAPRSIHNVNSDLGWRCFARHGAALRSNGAKLVGSLFSDEESPSGRRFGYAIAYLPKSRDFLDLIVTDNAPYGEALRRRYHLTDRRVRRVPFWCAPEPLSPATGLPGPFVKAASVLWAGRLCYQKRPDVLFAIALACREVEFHVFGEAEETNFVAKWRRKLAALPNVWMNGAYDDFHSIVERRSYQAFLYTTAFDGLPNVLLEAASHRLPIVAPPAIGGLADLIGAETGFPVDDAGEADSYIRALRRCLADPAEATRRAQSALAVVRAQHSREAFEAAMDEAVMSLT